MKGRGGEVCEAVVTTSSTEGDEGGGLSGATRALMEESLTQRRGRVVSPRAAATAATEGPKLDPKIEMSKATPPSARRGETEETTGA